MVKNLHWQLGI
jgi:hypothetical protein